MESYEVLREAIEDVGVKALAAELRLSPALVYKWCQESGRDEGDGSGARNPLDRLAEILRVTSNRRVVDWLCHEAGGFYVANPKLERRPEGVALLAETQRLVREFSQLLLTVTRAIENDGFIEGDEADGIRLAWERLKSTAEAFTVACEQGIYSAGFVGSDEEGDERSASGS